MDSNAQFEAAARHLFRHLHEARALRKNLLVRRFFEDPAIGGIGAVRERAVLERIHQAVRAGAERCRDADLAAGKDEHALRQYAIVVMQCLERRPIREVAASLGISYPHCYRERAHICRRVARYVVEYDDGPALEYFPEIDEFRFLLDRAMRRATFGDVDVALREYDGLIRDAVSPQQKIEALRASVSVAVISGDLERADRAHAEARTLLNELPAAGPALPQRVAHACVDLIEVELAANGGKTGAILHAARRAAARLEPVQADAPDYVRELYGESLFDLGCALANVGSLEPGYESAARAEALLGRIRTASSHLRSWIVVETCRLRNRLLMSSTHWQPSSQRLKALVNAFEHAYASGSLIAAMTALVGLTEHHAVAGNEDEALRAARSAVLLSKRHGSPRVVAHTAISVVLYLLRTRYWNEALALLPAQAQLSSADTRHQDVISYCAAARAFHMRAFDDAWALAKDATGRGAYYPALALRTRLIAARAAHELQRPREARTLIEEAVAVAERRGSAPLLREVYAVAARITGNRRFKHQASEIARLITA